MNRCACSFMAVGLLAMAAALQAEDAPRASQQVMIKTRVCQGDPQGNLEAKTLKVLAEPSLVTLVGRGASFTSGGERLIESLLKRAPISATPSPMPDVAPVATDNYIFHGTRMDFTVHEVRGDKLLATVTLEITSPAETNDKEILGTSGVCFRQKGLFPIGKPARITTKPDNQGQVTWVEFTLNLATSEPSAAAAAPSRK